MNQHTNILGYQHPTFIKFIAAAKNVDCLDIANIVIDDINSVLELGIPCVNSMGEVVLIIGTVVRAQA